MTNSNFSSKRILWFYFIYFITIPLGFLIRLLYSRTISVEDFGMIYAIISFFTLLSLFTNIGFSQSLYYFIPKFNIKNDFENIKKVFYYSLFIQLFLIIIYSLLIYYLGSFISLYYFNNLEILPYLKIFLFYFIFSNLFTLSQDIFVSYKLNLYYQTCNFFQLFFILTFSYMFFYFGFENLSYYYALSWVFSFIIIFIFYVVMLYHKFPYLFTMPKWDKKLFTEYIKYSVSIFLGEIGLIVLLQIDIMIITLFLSISDVAYYSNALSLISILILTFAIFNIILMPMLSEFKEKGEIAKINSIFILLYSLVTFLILPISLTLGLFPEQFLSLIFGNDYAKGAIVLMLLSLFSIFSILANYNLAFIRGLGLGNKLPKIIIPILFFNLILSIFFVKYLDLGLAGVAIPTVISWFLMLIFTLFELKKELGFKLNSKLHYILILNFVFIGIVLILKNHFLVYLTYFKIILILGFSYLIYLILGYLLKIYTIEQLYIFIPEEIRLRIRKIHNKYFKFLK